MDIVVPEEFKHFYATDKDNPIVKIPADVLRHEAKEITKITKRHKILAENMVRAMREAWGVGLAAPQIGISERLIVIQPDRKPIVMVNPKIIAQEGSEIGEEGCLSIPALYGDVERAAKVTVEAFDIKGRGYTYELEGYGARIAQHEIDHLDGILFIDKADPSTFHWQDPNPDNRE
ncbi:MAG: peptide deformylase [Armatimonadetes bacterium]|nr:peptide deformylase [Armatimonadota bacterium]